MNANFSIIWGTRQIKPKQLTLYLSCAVKLLKGMGIHAYDRVAICDENSIEYVILLLALWQLKAVAVPVSPRWPSKTISEYAFKVNARHVFRSEDIRRIVYYDARQLVEAAPLKELELDQEVTVIATSGSSGEAKAAVHTWGNHFFNAKGSNKVIALEPHDRWLLSLPLYHVAGIGIMVRCLLAGAGLVIQTDDDLVTAIERSRATHISLVSTQLQRLLADQANHRLLQSLKVILLGGSAFPQSLLDQSLSLGLNVYLSYGLTEMASQVATGKVVGRRAFVKVLPYRQLKISPEGEILVRGEVLFKGYVTGTRLPLPIRDPDYWYPTGDIGSLDAEGCLSVTGRRDNMFISGGENIHPEEIEKALLTIKGIQEAIVIPKKDKEFGQRPIAFIKFTGKALQEDQIVKLLEAILPRFKIPTAFLPWPQHLISQGLKISRQEFLKTIPRR